METIKINRNKVTDVISPRSVREIKTNGDMMTINVIFEHDETILPDDYIMFKRYAQVNDSYSCINTITKKVVQVINKETFTLQTIGKEKFVVESVSELNDGWYKVVLDRNPYIQGVDIENFKLFRENNLSAVTRSIMSFYDAIDGTTIELDDVVTIYGDYNTSLVDAGIIVDGDITDTTFFVKDASEVSVGMHVDFAFNCFVYFDDYGNGFLWETTALYHDSAFFNVPFGLVSDDESRNLYEDVLTNDIYVNEVVDSLSDEPIDMEKIKYTPAYYDKTTGMFYDITGLTFNFHFRNRYLKWRPENGLSAEEVKRFIIYEDGWYTDEDLDGWNNGFTKDNIYDNDTEDKLNESDSVAYLDFTDNDIENQKKKVSKSFMRCSYYTDKDPIDQSLLYYSTAFLDSGTLFGRYVKKKRLAYEKGEEWNERIDKKHIVRQSGETEEYRVSSQITIHDEYDLTKSSEGFNLYLFAADTPEINNRKPIYMKVEFNHAGYGRTIPFISWPKDNEGKPKKITIENYLKEVLYIPVNIMHYVKDNEMGKIDKYIYFFEGASEDLNNGIVLKNDNLTFNLFEPKLEIDE